MILSIWGWDVIMLNSGYSSSSHRQEVCIVFNIQISMDDFLVHEVPYYQIWIHATPMFIINNYWLMMFTHYFIFNFILVYFIFRLCPVVCHSDIQMCKRYRCSHRVFTQWRFNYWATGNIERRDKEKQVKCRQNSTVVLHCYMWDNM